MTIAQQRAFHLLKEAVPLAAAQEGRERRYLAQIAEAAVVVDPAGSLEILRQIVAVVRQTQLPPERRSFYARLAAFAAPHDVAFRDQLLREAIDEAQRAADDQELWERQESAGAFEQREDAAGWRQLLLFEIELWKSVLSAEESPKEAKKRLAKVLKAAGEKGSLPGDAAGPYDEWLLSELAALDPELMVAVWAAADVHAGVGKFCYHEAYRRHSNGFRDRITSFLIRCAVENGFVGQKALAFLAVSDAKAAVRAGRRLQENPEQLGTARRWGSEYSEVMCHFVMRLAAEDLDGALEIAEGEPNARVRRELIDAVAKVWAKVRPENVDRAVARLDNDVRKQGVYRAAQAELARRGKLDMDAALQAGNAVSLANASGRLPRKERLDFLSKCLRVANAAGGNLGIIVELIFKIDQEAGMRAIDLAIARARSEDYKSMSIYISRVSPEGLLKLYRANPHPEKLYSLRQFSALAQADPDFAEAEARKLPVEKRDTALAHVAVGIASSDLDRARKILAELPEEARSVEEIDIQENFLVGHPSRTAEVRSEHRMTILRQAAARIYRERGMEGVEEMLASLADQRETDMVLWAVAESTVSDDCDLAVELIRRIETTFIFVNAACSLAKAMVKTDRRDSL